MNLVKLRFLRGGEPQGKEYTYISKERVEVGDTVIVRKPYALGAEPPKGIITMVDVLETEVESFKDRLKEIVGKGNEETMRSGNPFGTCAYCGKQIMWIRTKAGKNMPVNPQMINYRRPEAGKKAEEKLVTPQGEIVAANRSDSRDAEGFGYISHFATCTKRSR